MTGLWPDSLRRLTVCDPMYPAPPATSTFIRGSFLVSPLAKREYRESSLQTTRGSRMWKPTISSILLTICLVLAGPAFGLDVKPLAIGSPAPDFNLPGVDGKQHTLG